MRLSFHVHVEDDLIANALYYERQCEGLGERFIGDYEQALADIERFPLAWPMIHDDSGFRRRQLAHFPFGVYYRVLSGVLRILALADLRRDQKPWLERE
ncbi:MAG: toxin ParE1/3/4 [Rhodothermales bacterium]